MFIAGLLLSFCRKKTKLIAFNSKKAHKPQVSVLSISNLIVQADS